MYQVGLKSNQLKSLNVTIDGIALTQSQILGIKIKYSITGFKITGELTFQDFSNLVENLPIRANNTVVFNAEDTDGNKNTETLKVIEVKYSKSDNGTPVLLLSLMDNESLSAIKSYFIKSYKEVTCDKIIKENLEKVLVSKKIDFTETQYKYSNFVVPSHVNFNILMHHLAKTNNMFLYQDREHYHLKDFSDLLGQKSEDKPFMYKTPNSNYRRRIYQYSVHNANMYNKLVYQPVTEFKSFSTNEKIPVTTKVEPKVILDKINAKSTAGTVANELPESDTKQYYRTSTAIDTLAENSLAKNIYQDISIEILVPGDFTNNVGKIVTLDLVNNTEHTEPDANLSGEWLIQEIVDIMTPDFIQRITLVRSKYSK
jgi:hypothetical protein